MIMLVRICLILFLSSPVLACAQLPGNPDQLPSTVPGLPPSQTPSSEAEGLFRLDVMVTDTAGKPATGLESKDFTLLDNGQPQSLVSFHAFGGVPAPSDPPAEVILVIDTISLPDRLASIEKSEVEKFLRLNGGHLAHPVSVFGLSDKGLWTVSEQSSNGNVLAEELAQNKQQPVAVRAIRRSPGQPQSLGFLASEDGPGLTALKALGYVAADARRRTGRKLLLWIGPGWGIGSGKRLASMLSREQLFMTINWFSTLLREARIVLYSISIGDAGPEPHPLQYQELLDGVESDRDASIDNLDRRVLAVQSGGRVVDLPDDLRAIPEKKPTKPTDRTPAIDLVGPIQTCLDEAAAFYTVTFDPAYTDNFDEYHDWKLKVARPGLTVRTRTGYYDQPYFYDRPRPAAAKITVEKLEQVLASAQGERDAELAQQLVDLELTERLTGAHRSALQAREHGAKTNAEVAALADASEFRDPPASEIPADPPPDPAAQQHMIILVQDYLSKTVPKLPNFFATRTTLRYEEGRENDEQTRTRRVGNEPLHLVDSSQAMVLYRNGAEARDSETKKRGKGKDKGLVDSGSFGPILGLVAEAIPAPGGLTWSRWERSAGGLRAVFRYAVAEPKSRFLVTYCCLPDGLGDNVFRNLSGYRGEIAIDPASGAILRLTVRGDLKPDMPMVRADTLVEYSPVQIGGETYICPLRSISITRWRTVKLLPGLAGEFRTFGPLATSLNEVSFSDYHVFRSQLRVLTGDDPTPQ